MQYNVFKLFSDWTFVINPSPERAILIHLFSICMINGVFEFGCFCLIYYEHIIPYIIEKNIKRYTALYCGVLGEIYIKIHTKPTSARDPVSSDQLRFYHVADDTCEGR